MRYEQITCEFKSPSEGCSNGTKRCCFYVPATSTFPWRRCSKPDDLPYCITETARTIYQTGLIDAAIARQGEKG